MMYQQQQQFGGARAPPWGTPSGSAHDTDGTAGRLHQPTGDPHLVDHIPHHRYVLSIILNFKLIIIVKKNRVYTLMMPEISFVYS